MATIRNSLDKILQAATTRTVNAPNAAVLLVPSTNSFHVNAAGANDPASITFTYSLIALDGPATFSATGCTITTSGNVATLTYANMPGSTASVTASVTVNGQTYSQTCFVTKVLDGSTGSTGTRGAGQYFATGSAWSDATADAATPGATNIAGDVVTISNGTTFIGVKGWSGSAWAAVAPTYDGGAIFPGTVTANKINGNSLIIRDASGNPLLGVGVPLAAGYEAPGTKNSDLTPSINAAASPGKGAALNSDPACANAVAWDVPTPGSVEFGTVGDGISGGTVIRSGSAATTSRVYSKSFPIIPGRIYRARCNIRATGSATKTSYFRAQRLNAAGGALGFNIGYESTAVPNAWTTWQNTFTAESTATVCYIDLALLWSNADGGYVEVQNVRIEDITEAYNAQSAADAANTAINHATTGLAQRLRANAINVLAGGGAVTIGSLTVDSAGNRTGGNGLGLTAKGLAAYAPSGAATITVDAVTGAIAVAGDISGSTGTFGAVTVGASLNCGQTAFDTGTGFSFSLVGGVPKMSIGIAGGNGLKWDGTNLIINNAQFDDLTSGALADVNSTGANGLRTYASRTAVPSGGRPPYRYSWTIEQTDITGSARISGSKTATVTVSGSANNNYVSAVVNCSIIDSNGRGVFAGFYVDATHGTPA